MKKIGIISDTHGTFDGTLREFGKPGYTYGIGTGKFTGTVRRNGRGVGHSRV